jgi:hypothetical protein
MIVKGTTITPLLTASNIIVSNNIDVTQGVYGKLLYGSNLVIQGNGTVFNMYSSLSVTQIGFVNQVLYTPLVNADNISVKSTMTANSNVITFLTRTSNIIVDSNATIGSLTVLNQMECPSISTKNLNVTTTLQTPSILASNVYVHTLFSSNAFSSNLTCTDLVTTSRLIASCNIDACDIASSNLKSEVVMVNKFAFVRGDMQDITVANSVGDLFLTNSTLGGLTKVAGPIRPDANELFDIGASNMRFNNIFSKALHVHTLFSSNAFSSNLTCTDLVTTSRLIASCNIDACDIASSNLKSEVVMVNKFAFVRGDMQDITVANSVGDLFLTNSTLGGLTKVAGPIRPDANELFDIGASNMRFNNIFSKAIYVSNHVYTSSDALLKGNIETIQSPLDTVLQLRGCTYTRLDDEDKEKRHMGMIAQEVMSVLPEVVSSSQGKLAITYDSIVGLLVEAVKDLTQEVSILKTNLQSMMISAKLVGLENGLIDEVF